MNYRMNGLVQIKHKNKVILTTQQLANEYETEMQVVTNNFNRNKDKYIDRKHYYCLGEYIKEI